MAKINQSEAMQLITKGWTAAKLARVFAPPLKDMPGRAAPPSLHYQIAAVRKKSKRLEKCAGLSDKLTANPSR